MIANRSVLTPLAVLSFTLLLLSTSNSIAQKEGRNPPSDEVMALINEGIDLRHQGEMDAALEKYNGALKLAPESPNVLYEFCLYYFQLGDYEQCLTYGERGMKYKSELQSQFRVVVGSCYDILEQPEKAIEIYEQGIAADPTAPMLHYNLALTYANMGKLTESEKAVKAELLINPEHPSSHFLLANLYVEKGERIPALLARARFLVLEPDGSRAPDAIKAMQILLTKGIKKGKEKGKEEGEADVTIMFDMSESKEGDFKGVELLLSLSTANSMIDSVQKSEYQKLKEILDLTFGMIGEKGSEGKTGRGFASEYYVPYFAQIQKKGYKELLIQIILLSQGDAEATAWLENEENVAKAQEFLEWSQGFAWKKG